MKNMKKIIPIAGIAVFCLVIYLLICFCVIDNKIVFDFKLIQNFLDFPSAFAIIVGGGVLAFAKMPKNINDFFKYFSKTSIIFGVIISMMGIVNMIGSTADPESLLRNVIMAPVSIFYGLIFSGISYALSRDTDTNE